MARGSSRVVMTSRIGRRGAMAHAKTSANNLIKALFTGRIQKRKTNPLHRSHLACNTRPVHTDGRVGSRRGPGFE
jgi:hypothetical protein